jgi:hypothetical protein
MLGLPVVRLLTQLDQLHAADVFRDDRHATMVGDSRERVQPAPPQSPAPGPASVGRRAVSASPPAGL